MYEKHAYISSKDYKGVRLGKTRDLLARTNIITNNLSCWDLYNKWSRLNITQLVRTSNVKNVYSMNLIQYLCTLYYVRIR